MRSCEQSHLPSGSKEASSQTQHVRPREHRSAPKPLGLQGQTEMRQASLARSPGGLRVEDASDTSEEEHIPAPQTSCSESPSRCRFQGDTDCSKRQVRTHILLQGEPFDWPAEQGKRRQD